VENIKKIAVSSLWLQVSHYESVCHSLMPMWYFRQQQCPPSPRLTTICDQPTQHFIVQVIHLHWAAVRGSGTVQVWWGQHSRAPGPASAHNRSPGVWGGPSLPCCKQQRHQSTVLVQQTVTGHLCLAANNSDISLVLVQRTVTGHLCLAANNSYISLQS